MELHTGDEYKTSMTWIIPSFAPSGHYVAKIGVLGVLQDDMKRKGDA